MKVLLISVNNEKDPYPVAPLGAAYVGSALKGRGHSVDLLDLCFSEAESDAIGASIGEFSPDFIGISIRNIDNLTFGRSFSYMPRIREMVGVVRAHTSAPVILGGSGFSIFPEAALRYIGAEWGVIGEGERALPMLVEAAGGGGVGGVPNLCYIREGSFVRNEQDLGHFETMPDRSLINNSGYLDAGGMGNIQSKRGCPFECSYCTYPSIDGRVLRLREPGAVADEMEQMYRDHGVDYVFFVDDIFNYPPAHAAELCEEIIRRGLKVGWTCFLTPKGMTSELALLMKRAGCGGAEFGSDSGAQKTLGELGKRFGPDEIASASECCRSADLPNAHYVILGGPGEDYSTLKETFGLFDAIAPDAVVALTGIRIYPGTALRERAVADGIIKGDDDLLDPVFYLSPGVDADGLCGMVAAHAGRRPNWIVPGLGIRYDTKMLGFLRSISRRGPLWDMLRREGR